MTDREEREPHAPLEAEADSEPGRKLNRMIAYILGIGLLFATGSLIAGAVLALSGRGPSSMTETSITDIPRAIVALEPGGFFYLGLFFLVATPVVRVIALAVGFARHRSWRFCAISLLVLAFLVVSAVLGSVA
jgi:uncharacterized membrane protein